MTPRSAAIALSSSCLDCVLLGGKGGRVLDTLSIAGSAGVESQSTLFPECRPIFTVVCRSTFFLSCRSISTSSPNSPSSSSRSMASFSVLGRSLFRGISDSVLGSSRIIGRDLFSPASSTTTCFSPLLISIALEMRSLKIKSIFPFRSVANLRFPVKAWFSLNFALPRRDPTVASSFQGLSSLAKVLLGLLPDQVVDRCLMFDVDRY
ncbi:hypothetical protein DY000_02007782 [Brassica cretica]|uniref:Secreted protein n=1 Tax=Brassica cretica TaxID=69181 RepID=A0ABQ7CAQ6_BRACR|nr:hypothetical protein DY000_02007782 [Brassica cretica]